VGVKTIGYGHACQPDSACNSIKAPLTEPQAAAMLAHELTVKYGPTLFNKITRPLNNNQYSALTSFVYNLVRKQQRGGQRENRAKGLLS
jgi:lysozyme